MKANFSVILLMVTLFLVSELFGIYVGKPIINYYNNSEIKNTEVNTSQPFIFITMLIVFTIILIVILRLNLIKLYLIWLIIASFISTFITLSILFNSDLVSMILTSTIIILKLKLRKNLVIHNLFEILTIIGVSIILSLFLNVHNVIIMLFLISIYDVISVFFTKHMIYIAETNKKQNLFPGVIIKKDNQTLILGGGDIGFILIFALSVSSTISSLFIIYFSSIGLLILYLLGKKDKYYPAMPTLTTTSLIGYIISKLIIV